MNTEFNNWWDQDDLTTQGNNFVDGTPAYWAWEGWCAGVRAEREACAKVCEAREDDGGEWDIQQQCANAIRARGEA